MANISDEQTKRLTHKSWFNRLIDGDLGLARTYWLYGFVVIFIANIILATLKSTKLYWPLLIPIAVYTVVIAVATWRAADKYEGAPSLAGLAKVASFLSVLALGTYFPSG